MLGRKEKLRRDKGLDRVARGWALSGACFECDFQNYFVRTGEELGSIAREVAKHFETQGTPIMIGGGALAFTIVGVAWNEQSGATEYLILDPHYTGEDNLDIIQGRVVMLEGYKATPCGWRGIDTFSQKDFYSLCCPQRPAAF